MLCKNCGKEFTKKYSKWSNGNFCCKHCARSYSSKEKIEELNILKSKIMKEKYKNKYYKNPKICPICGNVIPYEKRKYKSCSNHCSKLLGTMTKKYLGSNLGGGYRLNGHRKSYSGWYKGIWCDSTYELAYLIYCLDHDIDIKRCNESFEYEYEGKKHKYTPDFEINGELIEIKGYYSPIVDVKIKSVDKSIKILYYDDMKDIFNYVAKRYNKKVYNTGQNNFYELYDKNSVGESESHRFYTAK